MSSDDRWNGTLVSDVETMDFQHCLDASDLVTLPSCGHYYSWSNKGEGQQRTLSRIDWGLGNAAWMSQFGSAYVEYQNPGISDHCPLVIKCAEGQEGGGRPFRFFNHMTQHAQFAQVVQATWQNCHVGGLL